VYEFKYSASNLERYDMPLHWILQVNAYATLLEKENWNLVIINSQSLNIVVLPGKQSSLYYDSIFDSAASIYDSLQDNKAPAGPTYPFECTYCELKTICVNYLAKVNKNGK
jgi:CRISPR/Cas system-associated exonuclease Cas4 (RecB family)